jgi:hypothetical protein
MTGFAPTPRVLIAQVPVGTRDRNHPQVQARIALATLVETEH